MIMAASSITLDRVAYDSAGLTTNLNDHSHIISKDKTYWSVTLNNGIVVYQDDDKPLEPSSSWIRLKNFCESTGLYVVTFNIHFRCHTESLPPNKQGYYFSNGCRGAIFSGVTHDYFVAGYLENDIIECGWWKVPEIIKIEDERKNPADAFTKRCLITAPQNDRTLLDIPQTGG